MGDCRCLHVPPRKGQSDRVRFIRLVIGGARYSMQVCPDCHTIMSYGYSVEGSKQGSGRRQIRGFRRQPGDVEPVWFEVQVV